MGARAQLGSLDDPLGPVEGGSSAPRLPDWGSQVTACAASCHSGKSTALSNSYQQPMDLKFYKGSIFCATNSKAR